MATKLEGLLWRPTWNSAFGCLKGCLDYLGADLSLPWLFGATGHAFAINIHKELCPSGPTAWDWEGGVFGLGHNLGYHISSLETGDFWHELRSRPGYEAKVKSAWAFARGNLDVGLPVFWWAFKIPEYYVIYGWDEAGLYYSGPHAEGGAGPEPWQGLDSVGVFAVQRVEPAPLEQQVLAGLKQGLAFADLQARGDYAHGFQAFAMWAEALEEGVASKDGHFYNGACWAEARRAGADFLKEAGSKLPGLADEQFQAASAAYHQVGALLQRATDLVPFQATWDEAIKLPEGAALLREAAQAEARAVSLLSELVYKLED